MHLVFSSDTFLGARHTADHHQRPELLQPFAKKEPHVQQPRQGHAARAVLSAPKVMQGLQAPDIALFNALESRQREDLLSLSA